MNHKRKQTSYYRGYSTYYDYETEKWYYEDNDKYIKSENRPCARCGKTPTLSGADYCLKDLEVCDFIKAACCGHGERIGYISLQDGRIFREIDSSDILFKMFRLEDENKKLKEENEQLKEERNYFERKKCEYFNKYNKKHLDNIQLKEENEQLKEQVQILNKCCRHKSSDEYIKQAYADLNRREREKHSQGNATYVAKINQNEVIY